MSPRTNGIVRLQRNKTTTLMSIPKPFLAALHWKPGDQVLLEVDGDRLLVQSIESRLNIVLTSKPEARPDGPTT